MFGSRGKKESSSIQSGGRLTPVDVQQVQFRLALRGYNERDVDSFLDRVTEDLTARIEEHERLVRGGAVAAPLGGDGSVDVAAARSEADAIVARARVEASEILRQAMSEAAAVRGGAGGDPRGSIAPFLAKEREFLQGIGAIVQSHAEEIRGMVLALKAASPQAQTASPRSVDPASASPSELADED